jgi:hypothetical protein
VRWWRWFLEWLRKLFGRKVAAAAVGCIDFSNLTDPVGTSFPGTSSGTATFTTSNNRVRTANGYTGLDCDHKLTIDWAAPASQLTFKLLTTAQPATIEAFDSGNLSLGTKTQAPQQHVVSTVVFPTPGGSLRATVTSPANEVVLIEFCAT